LVKTAVERRDASALRHGRAPQGAEFSAYRRSAPLVSAKGSKKGKRPRAEKIRAARAKEAGLRKTREIDQAAAQKKWQAERDAEHVDLRRAQCNAYLLWHICKYKLCRRAHTCSRDPVACFDRHWPIIPEEMKVWWRKAITSLHAGCTPAEAVAAAQAEVARWKAWKIDYDRDETIRANPSAVVPAKAGTHTP
jgi:hypothetical protein